MKDSIKIFALILLTISLHGRQGYTQTLDSLLQLAVSQNTELKALQATYQAKLASADQVSQLPNPQIGLGVPTLRPETRLGPQIMMVSASQMFPWFGNLKAREDVVISMSTVEFEKIAALKLNLFYTIKSNYFELVYIKKKQAILALEIGLIESIEELSLSKVESGQGSIADVLRIQLKKDELKEQISVLENLKQGINARINEATKQPWATEVIIRDSLKSIQPLSINIPDFQQRASRNHPLMLMLDAEIEASENRINVNTSSNRPSIGVGIDYSLVNLRVDANPINNGRDILVPKLMLNIPIYRKSYQASNQIEAYNQEAFEWEKITLIDKMTRQIIEYLVTYDNAKLVAELSEKRKILAYQTYEILLTSYSTKGAGFDDLITIQSQLLTYELQLLNAQFQATIANAQIERLTGSLNKYKSIH